MQSAGDAGQYKHVRIKGKVGSSETFTERGNDTSETPKL